MATRAQKDLIRYYRFLRQYGLNDSHSGNASVRDGDTVWITPGGASADVLEPEDLVECRVDGTLGDGASLDARLHLLVYQRRPDTGAVLHSHGPHAVALTLDGRDFRPADFEGSLYFPRVPVLSVPYELYVDTAPDRVSTTLIDHVICVVRGHGVYARGETLDRAYKWSCSLELSARTAWIAARAGTLEQAPLVN